MLWPEIKLYFTSAGWEFAEEFTTAPGHASVLAKNYTLSGYDLIVAVGGDGTLSEVINGVLNSTPCKVALIPAGTGNDFARSLGIPLDWQNACKLLVQMPVREIDVGQVNGRYFINVAGLGFDAEVAAEINKSLKKVSGMKAYLIAVFKCLYNLKPIEIVIKTEQKTVVKSVLLMAVGNGKSYGGGFMITPQAKIDDGLLDICLIEKTSMLDLILNLPTVMAGRHLKHPKVRTFRACSVEVLSKSPVQIHTDGEITGTTPALFSISPTRLSFIAR